MKHYLRYMYGAMIGSIGLSLSAQGIPEPGLVMYGSISNASTGGLLDVAAVQWTVAPPAPGNPVSLATTVVNVNGQYFYISHVPFETRFVPPLSLPPSPNTLALANTSTTYTRSVRVNGTNATILSSSRQGTLATFSFQASDRGALDRVDLVVTLGGESYDAWSQRIFGSVRPQSEDFDGDGASNFSEYRAGTDPKVASSVFKFIEIRPALGGGILINWSSIPQKRYTLERSINVGTNYAALPSAAGMVATGTVLSYSDTAATGAGPYFYRLRVD